MRNLNAHRSGLCSFAAQKEDRQTNSRTAYGEASADRQMDARTEATLDAVRWPMGATRRWLSGVFVRFWASDSRDSLASLFFLPGFWPLQVSLFVRPTGLAGSCLQWTLQLTRDSLWLR